MDVDVVSYLSKGAEQDFVKSLKNTGFVVLKDHPISRDLIDKTYETWKDFFALPLDEKNSYLFDARETGAQTGYFPFKAENAKGYSVQDLKEFFHFAPHKKAPEMQAQMTKAYFQEVTQLAHELLKWAENGLPEKISKNLSMPLKQMAEESTLTLLRILHYPPLQGDEEEGSVRAAPHEDINLMTVLPFATAPGLEIKDSKGNWHPVPGDPGMIVINVGDMLAHTTQNYYTSTTHRVVNPEVQKNEARYSLPLFFQPNKDVRLSPIHTAGSYFEERFREQGLVKDKN
ncbi:MAG: isopenicillin N synthase family oxygenase [Proteobacteria bacterium]|nr:isopenicillin N synthase family oxygenase [Pseudomonadota bacterium]